MQRWWSWFGHQFIWAEFIWFLAGSTLVMDRGPETRGLVVPRHYGFIGFYSSKLYMRAYLMILQNWESLLEIFKKMKKILVQLAFLNSYTDIQHRTQNLNFRYPRACNPSLYSFCTVYFIQIIIHAQIICITKELLTLTSDNNYSKAMI